MEILVRDIIDALTTSAAIENTVDKLDYGDPESKVKGIAVTFLATHEIIEQARILGDNLIISHEGIFYSHRDRREALKGDPVFQEKCRLLEKDDLAVFRFHDYIHKYVPDGIMAGLLHALQWENNEVMRKQTASVVQIPEMTLRQLIPYIKDRLNLQYVRFTGDLEMGCKRVGLLVGYRGGGELVLPLFEKENIDLVIYGEGPEWETPEYVRDAMHQGNRKSLIVLGHAESEMPGMEYMAQWLQERFPGIPVHFIPSKPVLQIL